MNADDLVDGDWLAFRHPRFSIIYCVGRITCRPNGEGMLRPMVKRTSMGNFWISRSGMQLDFMLGDSVVLQEIPVSRRHLSFIMALLTHDEDVFRTAGREALAFIQSLP